MAKRPTEQIEFSIPSLNHKQAMLVLLGLRQLLAEALITVAEKIGPQEALELKARLIEQAKGAVPSGIAGEEEAHALTALVRLIDSTIGTD